MTELNPYGGYLAQVTHDYFYDMALRGTHNAVIGEMPPELRAQTEPWLHDTIPIPGVPTPPLMRELNRATLGAWGNYIGDLYSRGRIAPVEHRREVAIRSTLTMCLLGTADSAVRQREVDARNPAQGVRNFHRSLSTVLLDGEAVTPVDGLAIEPQVVAFNLAQYMHGRLGMAHSNRSAAARADMSFVTAAVDRQLTLPLTDVESFVAVARDLGEAAAWMALRHTELANPDEPRRDQRGRNIALALGRIGGYINHGSQLMGAIADHMPTYATAILLREGGASGAALKAIDERRRDLVNTAVKAGRAALEPGNRPQEGIFRMAVRLLDVKERIFARRGNPRKIDQALSADPYWAA
jgi:hypothetical protein